MHSAGRACGRGVAQQQQNKGNGTYAGSVPVKQLSLLTKSTCRDTETGVRLFQTGISLAFDNFATRTHLPVGPWVFYMGHTCGEPNEIDLTADRRFFYRCFPGGAECGEADALGLLKS